jgi:hypothetical protein
MPQMLTLLTSLPVPTKPEIVIVELFSGTTTGVTATQKKTDHVRTNPSLEA